MKQNSHLRSLNKGCFGPTADGSLPCPFKEGFETKKKLMNEGTITVEQYVVCFEYDRNLAKIMERGGKRGIRCIDCISDPDEREEERKLYDPRCVCCHAMKTAQHDD